MRRDRMSDYKDGDIVPTKINPKFGIVVNLKDNDSRGESLDHTNRMEDHMKNKRTGFTCAIERAYPKKNHYTMESHHEFHFLHHTMSMEIVKDDNHMGKTLICQFPNIDIESLSVFVDDDDYLIGAILVHFQMNIMNELLRFCKLRGIENLIVKVDTFSLEGLAIYEDISCSRVAMVGAQEPITKICINVTEEILDDWQTSIDITLQETKMALWRDQAKNVSIRNYLKYNPCNDLFC
jgi:hypothetical protein